MKILPAETAVQEAVRILNQPGSVLLVPTETVYGLVCSWHDSAARARIYELKHRSENKPFAAFIPDLDSLPAEAVLRKQDAQAEHRRRQQCNLYESRHGVTYSSGVF